MSSPLVIGGAGGSGTRVVARIVRLGGRYMGNDRNGSEDTMPVARFEWRWGLDYLESGPSDAMVQQLEAAVDEHLAERPDAAPWGWKHPHSYLLLPFLLKRFPQMRFIHVIRDGRDIAFSRNQQQAERYGELLGRPDEPLTLRSAAWWAWANVWASRNGKALGHNYLLVRLEDLCAEPDTWTRRIVEFSGGDDSGALAAEVKQSDSVGSWRRRELSLLRSIEAVCRNALRFFGYLERGRP